MITMARLIVLGIMLAMAMVVIFAGAIPRAKADEAPFVTNQVQAWYAQVSGSGGACNELEHSYRVRILRLTQEYALVEVTDERPHEVLGRPPIDPGTIFKIDAKGVVWNQGNPTEHSLLFTNSSGSVACLVPKSTT